MRKIEVSMNKRTPKDSPASIIVLLPRDFRRL